MLKHLKETREDSAKKGTHAFLDRRKQLMHLGTAAHKKVHAAIFTPAQRIGRVQRPPVHDMHPDHQYENIAFQGGGAKGQIYIGAVR